MGSPHENQTAPVDPYRGGPWVLTDDTQLTLATCEAITTSGRVDPATIASSFLSWFQERRLSGIGASTYHALNGLAAGSHWALVGRKGEMSAGNGAAMRIAPLAFVCDPRVASDRVVIRDVCRITHHDDEAYAGALAVLLAIHVLSSSEPSSNSSLATEVANSLPDCRVRDQILEVAQLPSGIQISEVAEKFGCSGYVVHTVPLAVFAVQQYPALTFEQIVTAVIAAGGDTDTNASITGHILGTVVGYSHLPEHLVKRVPSWEHLCQRASDFARAVDGCA